MLNNIYLCFQVHFLNFIRNKGALFWALTFPTFTYIVFYTVFSGFNNDNYAFFLLSGILGMTLTADGLLGVGVIIKQSYLNGTIRLLKKMPINIIIYFVGLIINRFLIIVFLMGILFIALFFIASDDFALVKLPSIFIGIFAGLWIFSFLGLCLSFMNIDSQSEKGVSNMAYFFILFTSNSFYQLSMFNEKVSRLGDFLPLNSILHLLRSEPFDPYVLIFWVMAPVLVFYYLFSKVQYSR